MQFFFRAGDHVISIHALREEGDFPLCVEDCDHF